MILLSSADRESEAASVVDDLFRDKIFRFAFFKSGWANSSAIFICWGQEVFCRNGWYYALGTFVEHAETQVIVCGGLPAGGVRGPGAAALCSQRAWTDL